MSEPTTTSEQKCTCGHTRHWHGQEIGTEGGSGACESCHDCEKFTPAALSKEPQGETEHRLSREDGERLEDLHEAAVQLAVQLSPVKTARTERTINVAHEMAERLRVELRQLSQGILSGTGQLSAAAFREKIRALPKEDGIASEFLRRSTVLAALSQPPQEDVERLREAKTALADFDDHGDYEGAVQALRNLLAAPDVERLGGEAGLREALAAEVEHLRNSARVGDEIGGDEGPRVLRRAADRLQAILDANPPPSQEHSKGGLEEAVREVGEALEVENGVPSVARAKFFDVLAEGSLDEALEAAFAAAAPPRIDLAGDPQKAAQPNQGSDQPKEEGR